MNDFLSKEALKKIATECLEAPYRHFFFDYDGTLKEIPFHYKDASPTPEILHLLHSLSELKNTEVHIVTGRGYQNTEDFFGKLPLHLSAEHGYLNRMKGSSSWEPLEAIDKSWMEKALILLEKKALQLPGGHLETKSCTLTWHYRQADPEIREAFVQNLKAELQALLKQDPVSFLEEHNLFEIRPQGIHKGRYIEKVLKTSKTGAILCFGDDNTDRDMYRVLPSKATAIHVARRCPETDLVISSPQEVREFLFTLLALS